MLTLDQVKGENYSESALAWKQVITDYYSEDCADGGNLLVKEIKSNHSYALDSSDFLSPRITYPTRIEVIKFASNITAIMGALAAVEAKQVDDCQAALNQL